MSQFADELEKADDFTTELNELIRRNYKENEKIIFNGNNYSDEWLVEAEKRGLKNLLTTADATPYFETPENIALFTRHGVLTETEIHSRTEILLDNYCKVLNIEALTMLEMAKKEILPAVLAFSKEVADTALTKKQLSSGFSTEVEETLVNKLSSLLGCLQKKIDKLDEVMIHTKEYEDVKEASQYYKNSVFTAMQELRAVADELEVITGKQYWPFPSYSDLLFSVM